MYAIKMDYKHNKRWFKISGIFIIISLFGVYTQEAPTWDYLLYTQRWAPGACEDWLVSNDSASCYYVPRNYWTVHGLWPGNTTGGDPFNCNDTPLNITEISTIMDSLITRWPTTRNLTNNFYDDCVTFWQHEWDKHGTCAMSLPKFSTIFDYFDHSLKWNLELDVYKSLEKHGIVPDANKGYDFQTISDVLEQEFGKLPDVICTANNLIHEVRSCFDLEANLIDCTKIQTNCTKTMEVLYQ